MSELRRDLLAGAQLIEIETRGFLPASGFVKLIDKGIMPHTRPGDEFVAFLPTVVAHDAQDRPVEVPHAGAGFGVGAVACLGDRAIFAWMKGMLRLKFFAHVVSYDAITEVTAIAVEHVKGLDITADGQTFTVMFAERLSSGQVEEYRSALMEDLSARAGIGTVES